MGEVRAWLVKKIFDKARGIPPAEREAFVRERSAEATRASAALVAEAIDRVAAAGGKE